MDEKKACFLCNKMTTGFIRQLWGYICKACCKTNKERINEMKINEKQRERLWKL